jgi:NNP family nitrate/nitrite transporter-like MFS transporter
MGNLGGIAYALVFRFQPVPIGKAFWIAGIIAMVCGRRFFGDNSSLMVA